MPKNNTIGRIQCYHWYTKDEDGIGKTPNYHKPLWMCQLPIQLSGISSTVKLGDIEAEPTGLELYYTAKHAT